MWFHGMWFHGTIQTTRHVWYIQHDAYGVEVYGATWMAWVWRDAYRDEVYGAMQMAQRIRRAADGTWCDL